MLKKLLFIILLNILFAVVLNAQSIKTNPYWQQLKTDVYQGKQDDIFFINDSIGWYCNGSGKIYKTTNSGTDWKLIYEKKGTFFRCIVFMDSLQGFAGNIGTEYFPNVEDTVPLYKTFDGGKSWTSVTYKGATVKGLCAIDIYKEHIINAGKLNYKTHIFCGGRVGSPAFLLISHDNGKTFTSMAMNRYCNYILDIKFFNLNEGIICAASEGELDKTNALILLTKDGGKTWKKVYQSKRPFEITWKCYFPSRKTGYVTVQSYDTLEKMNQRYVAKTKNGGKKWKELKLVKDINVREFGVAFTDDKHGWVGAVPMGFETFNGGKTWQKSYMGTATNKIRIINKPNGEKIAMAIGVNVSKNKSVIESGYDAIAAMRNAYAGGRWYKNFTFSQQTHFYKNGKEESMEVWHEAATFPAKLIIKYNSKDSKNGMLFENNKISIFKDGAVTYNKPMINDLLLTAFDVYFLKPYETMHLLDSLGYNLKLVREDIFNGRKVLVVGAIYGDEVSNQLWIDAERFYLHKVIYKIGKVTNNVVFGDYEKIENNWVAKKVTFRQNGIITQIEDYYDVKFPKEINADTFKPEKFAEIKLE